MVTIFCMILCVTLDAQPAPTHKGSDAELIANWVCGKDPTKAFAKPFGDRKYLAERKDPLLYTDLSGVEPPAGIKLVNYEFIQARIRRLRSGYRGAPAVLIVRSSLAEPDEDKPVHELRADKGKSGGRVYYVEVAIGNAAWHRFKVVVRDEGGKPKAEIIRYSVS